MKGRLQIRNFKGRAWRGEIKSMSEFAVEWLRMRKPPRIEGWQGYPVYHYGDHAVRVATKREEFRLYGGGSGSIEHSFFHEMRHAWQYDTGAVRYETVDFGPAEAWLAAYCSKHCRIFRGDVQGAKMKLVTWRGKRFLLLDAEIPEAFVVWTLRAGDDPVRDFDRITRRRPRADNVKTQLNAKFHRQYRGLPWEQDANRAAREMAQEYRRRTKPERNH